MGLDVCISPIKATIGTHEDYSTETQYLSELEIIDNLITLITDKIKDQTGEVFSWNENDIGSSIEDLMQDSNLTLYSEQIGNYNLIHHLRRYAAHIDINGKPPENSCELEDASDDKLLLKIYDEEVKTKFPHLIDHSDCDGYYIPCDFPKPLWIKPSEIGMDENDDDILISVGSSICLLKELLEINKFLNIPITELEDLDKYAEQILDDDWEFVKWSWAVLHYMCQKCTQLHQPIIFC